MSTGAPVTQDPRFTEKSREWFDKRYAFSSQGIYFPHQPIYGFSRFDKHIHNYRRTYHILRVMEELEFSSFLDVGCAEGYFPNLIQRLFGVRSYGTDFAFSGVKRAHDIYRIPGAAGDANCLPFRDRAFDLVLCSETLEHVADPERVIGELKRVCNKYLITTTPAARSEAERSAHLAHVDPGLIFDHFHFFTEDEMRRWLGTESIILGCGHRRMHSLFNRVAGGDDLKERVWDLYRFVQESCPDAGPDTLLRAQSEIRALLEKPPTIMDRMAGPGLMKILLVADWWLSRWFPQGTLAFLTVTPCQGAELARRRRRIPNLLQFLLVENRADLVRLAPSGEGGQHP